VATVATEVVAVVAADSQGVRSMQPRYFCSKMCFAAVSPRVSHVVALRLLTWWRFVEWLRQILTWWRFVEWKLLLNSSGDVETPVGVGCGLILWGITGRG
jgi:hypothetical protein